MFVASSYCKEIHAGSRSLSKWDFLRAGELSRLIFPFSASGVSIFILGGFGTNCGKGKVLAGERARGLGDKCLRLLLFLLVCWGRGAGSLCVWWEGGEVIWKQVRDEARVIRSSCELRLESGCDIGLMEGKSRNVSFNCSRHCIETRHLSQTGSGRCNCRPGKSQARYIFGMTTFKRRF